MKKSNLPNNWSLIKKKWRALNPPDVKGNYICWICKQPVHDSRMTLDHVAEAALYPEYAAELSNLRPSHQFCNEQRSKPLVARQLTRFGKTRPARIRRRV